MESMLRLTNETLQNKGVRFVIWSEAAGGAFYDDSVESYWQTPVLSSLFANASSLATSYNATIGVTYLVWAQPNDYTNNEVFNVVSFVNGNGEWIANYTKRYPVPVIEGDVVASNQDLAFIHASTVGPFNAAICYDLDHPEFVRRGSSTGLLIQTANTWGVVGHYHAISSSFRAIENGMHLLRCGSQGPSGLWDPYGQEYLYDVRKDTGVVLFQLPYSPSQIWTFYMHAGFVIDYILFAAGGLFILLFAMSFKRSLKHRF
jgi:apolipoprotein N-acyltransferase